MCLPAADCPSPPKLAAVSTPKTPRRKRLAMTNERQRSASGCSILRRTDSIGFVMGQAPTRTDPSDGRWPAGTASEWRPRPGYPEIVAKAACDRGDVVHSHAERLLDVEFRQPGGQVQSKPPIYLGRARRESLHAQAPHRAGDGLASDHLVNLLERCDYPQESRDALVASSCLGCQCDSHRGPTAGR